MPAELKKEQASESISGGFAELTVTRTYQVFTTSRNTNFTTVIQASGLPALGSSKVFGTQTLWCISRVPNRVDEDKTGRKWNVVCTFKNNTGSFARDQQGNPVNDPVEQVKQVDITYQEFSEPVTNAEFLNITFGGPHGVGEVVGKPPWFHAGDKGPVMVSTGEPVLAERVNYRKNVVVVKTFRDWNDDWEDYKGTINSDSVTITERDSQGVRATYSFAPRTLRMKPITKQTIWKDAKTYYRVRFEMEHNADTWIHSELDVSQKRRVYVNGYNNDETNIADADELLSKYNVKGSFGFTSVVTKDEEGTVVAIGDPVRLNGYGNPVPFPREDGNNYSKDRSFFVNFKKYTEKAFGALGL